MAVYPVYAIRDAPRDLIERVLRRSELDISGIEPNVRRIIDDVKERGDEAIVEFLSSQVGRRVRPEEISVRPEEISEAYRLVDDAALSAIKHMIANVRRFHEALMPRGFTIEVEPGLRAGMDVFPLDSAGLYVPAGKASYPSVSVMVTVPASVARVPRIAVASPPWGNDMKMEPATLVAAHLSGAHEFYIMGGAHAVAAFALGTRTVKRADVIAGPGGPWTYAAKRLVRDLVRVDLPAGPSEALVIADGTVDPGIVAWDVLNEAEHGPDSSAVLVTTSMEHALRVAEAIDRAIQELPEPRRSYVLANAGKYSAIFVASSMDEAIDFANTYAAEHLLIDSSRADEIYRSYRGRLRNFGTVCLGTPISAGNYGLGPNATLPTGGYARLYSGLSVDAFLRKPTIEAATAEGLRDFAGVVLTMAEHEGFPSHARSVEARLGQTDK
ncbi:MAG: histidinol dehydrogenase [Nitrososphaeria archaeon]